MGPFIHITISSLNYSLVLFPKAGCDGQSHTAYESNRYQVQHKKRCKKMAAFGKSIKTYQKKKKNPLKRSLIATLNNFHNNTKFTLILNNNNKNNLKL